MRTNGVWTFFNAQLFEAVRPARRTWSRRVSTNVLAMPEFDETPEQILLQLKFSDTQTLRGSRSADIPLAGSVGLSARQSRPAGGRRARAAAPNFTAGWPRRGRASSWC